MTDTAVINTELELRLVVPGAPHLPVLADLSYCADDPWAVQVAFRTGTQDRGVVEWLFARQLLTDGVAGPAGEGDVRVWPSEDDRPRVGSAPVVHLAMASPSGSALFEIDRDDVVEFLQQTYLLVPTGAEHTRVDLDAEMAVLLER